MAVEALNRYAEGVCVGNLGICCFEVGFTKRAIKHYEDALAIARELKDRDGEARHLWNLGGCYYNLGNTDRAAELTNVALAICRKADNRFGEGFCMGALAEIALDQSSFE
jgi:tetratricopeptide (TPR) repeat protein